MWLPVIRAVVLFFHHMVPEIKLRSSGLAVGSFAHGAISPALRVFIVFIYVRVPELAHVEVRGQLR